MFFPLPLSAYLASLTEKKDKQINKQIDGDGDGKKTLNKL